MSEDQTQNGFVEGEHFPIMPVTRDDYQRLLDNPTKPPQNQSAPSLEVLNPHIFGDKD